MRDRRRGGSAALRIACLTLVALATLPLLASGLGAQAGLRLTEDASTPPKGFLRFRPIIAWTRYDTRFTPTGVEPLGATFTAESLGATNFAPLSVIETLTRDVSQAGPAYRLSLGRSRLNATAREEVMPLVFEYGVTNRFAVGFVVPIVRRRLSTLFQLDSIGANVGPNLNRTNQQAAQQNDLLQSEFATAVTQLQARLTTCQADPSGPGCAAVLAQGPALLSESQAFATQVGLLYGSSAQPGAAFVPRSSSVEQTGVTTRVADFNSRYFALLGSNLIQTAPRGAAGPPGSEQFQSFVVDDAGGDSLNTQERFGIGDLELGFKFRVIDRPVTELRRLGVQFALAASARWPTGSLKTHSEIVDMRLGDGDPIVDVRGALDARFGRFGLLSLAHQGFRLSEEAPPIGTSAQFEPNPTNVLELDATPRWHLSEVFVLHGAYSYQKTDVSSNQLAGGGVSFMPSASGRANRTPPMEVRFTHLEAIGGQQGQPKFFREQLDVRIYFRLFR